MPHCTRGPPRAAAFFPSGVLMALGTSLNVGWASVRDLQCVKSSKGLLSPRIMAAFPCWPFGRPLSAHG